MRGQAVEIPPADVIRSGGGTLKQSQRANDIESVRIEEIPHEKDMTRIGVADLWKATAAPRREYDNSLSGPA